MTIIATCIWPLRLVLLLYLLMLRPGLIFLFLCLFNLVYCSMFNLFFLFIFCLCCSFVVQVFLSPSPLACIFLVDSWIIRSYHSKKKKIWVLCSCQLSSIFYKVAISKKVIVYIDFEMLCSTLCCFLSSWFIVGYFMWALFGLQVAHLVLIHEV